VFKNVLDLTHSISDKIPAFDDNEKLSIRTLAGHEQDGYFAREITLPEHCGTHLDAPAHMAPGRWTVDEIPPERLLGPLVVLDVSARIINNPDYRVATSPDFRWSRPNFWSRTATWWPLELTRLAWIQPRQRIFRCTISAPNATFICWKTSPSSGWRRQAAPC
jgi:hypothetical protein